MRDTLHTAEPVGDALSIATALVNQLPKSTSVTAKKLYEALTWLGLERSRRLGHSPNITEAVLHVPLEQVAVAVGVSRWSVQRHLPQLRALGLVDSRPHKGRLGGRARNTGTVWAIRLSPNIGRKARLSADDLRFNWRDMDADARAGRWSKASLHPIQSLESKLLKLECLLAWTLPPHTQTAHVALYGAAGHRAQLERVLDVTSAPNAQRGEAVDLAAQALAQALRDQSSLNWHRRVLWMLLRRFDATGVDHSYSVYLAAQRARTDALEGFARQPGALLQSRLQQAAWWSEVMNGPPTRVASRPAQA